MANYNDKKTLNPYRCKDCSKKNMFSCSHVFQKKTCPHVLMSFKKNMSSCSHVFQKKTCPHVPMSFKKNMSSCSHVFQTKTCPHVLMSFKKKTCPHVLMSFKQKHVLLFFCLFKNHVLMSQPVPIPKLKIPLYN